MLDWFLKRKVFKWLTQKDNVCVFILLCVCGAPRVENSLMPRAKVRRFIEELSCRENKGSVQVKV